MAYPQPIDYADITVGMDVTAAVVWGETGASSTTRGIVTEITREHVTFDTGATTETADSLASGATVTYQLMSAPDTVQEPDRDTILLDDTGAAWQRRLDTWFSINGDQLAWPAFLTAHPTFTLLQDVPAAPLPDPPPAGYPVTITPDDARLGMDLRVTVTYAAGGSKVVRGVCPWVQQNPPPTDDFPSFLFLPGIGGEQLIADPAVLAQFDQQAVKDQSSGRFVVQYDPLPAGITLLVEQMQSWTADSSWDVSGIPEPPVGAVVRSKNGIAWQRTADATADDPAGWYLTGQGMWSSVAGDFSRSFLWLWGVAAPFTLQEAAP